MGGCGLILAVAVAVLPAAASAQTSPEDFALRARSVAGAIPLLRPGQFNCTIKPLRVVEVTSAITGVAARVLVRPGQQVAAGDPLVELDAAMARAELALGEARASDDSALRASILRRDGLARKEERLARGLARGAVSPADHDDAALELALAAADVERQKAALEMAALDLE
ncbi:biotin/lipoyl-binding protein, partial [Rhodovulum sulfidophilum]|uniref:biotin/lipoyl-binding protein n=1 Tax=Rhodovulum sulfidophilum TaxID=35806 RepID=UPI0019247977